MTSGSERRNRVRVREVARAYGPSYATLRRSLESGWFSTARLEYVEGVAVPAWTVDPVELAEWYALRAPGDEATMRALRGLYTADLFSRFLL